MILRRSHALVLAAALVAGAALLFAGGAPATRVDQAAVEWPAGKSYVYALSWSTTTETRLFGLGDRAGGAPVKTSLDLDGDLVLSSYGRRGDGWLLEARLERVTRADLTALEHALLPSLDAARGELEGHAATFRVSRTGDVADVRFAPTDPALFRYVMQAVLTELAIDVRDDKEWTARIEGPSGKGTVRFAHDRERPGVLARSRDKYDALSAWPGASDELRQNLDSHGSITFDPSGTLATLSDEERLEAARPGAATDVASRTRFSLVKKGERPFTAKTLPELEDRVPARQETETAEQLRERLERRTAGMTLAGVVDDIRIYSTMPRDKSGRWAWLAEGYLALHPEACDALVDQMRSLDTNGRAYAVDLLVIVGHDEAQTALRRAFDETIVVPGYEKAMLVQRLARLQRPSRATADWVLGAYAAAKARHDVPITRATAIALGGIVAATAKTDRAAARALEDPLVLDLYAATDPGDVEALLLAVGNASLEEDVIAIRLRAHDESTAVRAAVATALRRLDGPEIRLTLQEFFADAAPEVQSAALRSLERRDVEVRDLAAMRDVVEEGLVPRTNVHALVNFLAAHKSAGPDVDLMLDALLRNPAYDPETKARIARVRTGTT